MIIILVKSVGGFIIIWKSSGKNKNKSNFKGEQAGQENKLQTVFTASVWLCLCVSSGVTRLLCAFICTFQQDVNQRFGSDPLGAGQPTGGNYTRKISGF